MLLKKYHQFCKAKGTMPVENPLFAIVCATDSTIYSDVQVIVETLNGKGYNDIYSDPRQFEYDGEKLTKDGKKFTLYIVMPFRNFFMNLIMVIQMLLLKHMKTEIYAL